MSEERTGSEEFWKKKLSGRGDRSYRDRPCTVVLEAVIRGTAAERPTMTPRSTGSQSFLVGDSQESILGGCALACSLIDWLSPSDLDRMALGRSKPGWSAREHSLSVPLTNATPARSGRLKPCLYDLA